MNPSEKPEASNDLSATTGWAPWSDFPPTKTGIYEFRCDETDRAPERLKVKVMRGEPYVECRDVGEVPVDTYHYNLGHPQWRGLSESVNDRVGNCPLEQQVAKALDAARVQYRTDYEGGVPKDAHEYPQAIKDAQAALDAVSA